MKKVASTFMRLKILLATLTALQVSKTGKHAKYFANNLFFHFLEDKSQILRGKVNSRLSWVWPAQD